MGKWRRAFGLKEKEEVVVLADEKEDIEVLIEPVGTEKMTGHAEQHSALTRIQRDNVVKFAATEENITELEKEVNRNTGDIDDISEYLGGIYFEISLGVDKYVFDTQQTPTDGNFTAFSYNFDPDNTVFWINAYLGDGTPSTLFEKARPGDKLSISYPSGTYDNGQYFINSTRLDGEIWIIEGDFIQGSGRLGAGKTYDIEVIHVTKQFDDNGVGSPNAITKEYVDGQDELKLDKTGGFITGQLAVADDLFLNGGQGKQTINVASGFAGYLKYAGTPKLTWGNELEGKAILNMNNNRIRKVAAPVEDTDVANREYVDSKIDTFATIEYVDAKNDQKLPETGGNHYGDLEMNSGKITGLALPEDLHDAASKKYVDSMSAGGLEFGLPKFYPSGKRDYKCGQSVSSVDSSGPWFVPATSHTNGTGNMWPGNANAIHLYYDADQHDMIATGAGTILIFDKEDNKTMIHAVVTGSPVRQTISGRDCWSFEIVSIEAIGRQWDWDVEYRMTLSGVFWAAASITTIGVGATIIGVDDQDE